MSPIEVLKNHYVGKTITGGGARENYIGYKILDITMENYEPIFEFWLEHRDGKPFSMSVLAHWNVEVK
jgi:hypothetical protein